MFALFVPNAAVIAKANVLTDASEASGSASLTAALRADQGNSLTASSSAKLRAGNDQSATGTAQKENRENASTTARGNGGDISEEHRSAVASFVQSLLQAADRDGGIGADVRAIAKSQNDSASTTAAAIRKVENRSSLKSFLFGTDWKNIGTLRSQIARSENDSIRLEESIGEASDASVKADLEAQLKALKAEQAKVQAFVDTQANKFSLLGWFTKLFVSASANSQ